MSWDPAQYLKYASERLRPALDLMARVSIEAPGTIVDLGCGAGNVTQILADRWPHARVVGVDNSTEMLAVARASTAGEARRQWIDADLATWAPAAPVDIVFSNAALHWHDDHAQLFPRIFGWVAPGGVLAVQMPDQNAAPSHVALAALVSSARWRDRLAPLLRRAPVAPVAAYFRLLAAAARTVDAWTTEYLHVLPPSARRRASGGRLDEGHRVDAVSRGARSRLRSRPSSRSIPRASPRPIRRCPMVACCSRSGAFSSSRRERFGKATRPIRASRAGYVAAASRCKI